jgi:HD-like signal output (HDOD) protein
MESISSFKQNLYGSALKKKLFQGLDSLLPMPQVVLKAQNLLTDPNSSFEELANIIETDQEITLNILNLANSAYYSLKNEVCSVRQACVIVGLSVIGEIIMAAGTSKLFGKALEAYDMNPKDLWQHSLAVALSSKKIAEATHPALANEAFLSGLFHDAAKSFWTNIYLAGMRPLGTSWQTVIITILRQKKIFWDSTIPRSGLNCAKNGNFPKRLAKPSAIIIP